MPLFDLLEQVDKLRERDLEAAARRHDSGDLYPFSIHRPSAVWLMPSSRAASARPTVGPTMSSR